MRFALTIAAVPLLLFSAMTSPLAHAQDGHEHHAPATASQEVPAQRYATDAPLRKGMAQIRIAVDALGHYERGHMGAQQAVTFATTIQEQIAYLVANCKLEPQADAALHGIIAKLGAGAQALKNDPADLAAIPPMREALADYRRTFDDPASEPAADQS
ncbi:MAG TPA: DnrO protein [Lysobacter sp.]|nr:DnrO protein [Lysobacter sp.]